MIEGVVQASEEGTPQGGPLSPLLANIYLDALDQELEQRGLAFSRYADDCNIYVSSRAGGGTSVGERHRLDQANTSGWKSTRPRAGWGDPGNGSSWDFDQPGREDRNGPQECGTIQTEGPGDMAKLPESEQ